MKIIDLQQGSPEWHAWRLTGIGSSDIAAIMGESPWKTALDVYNEKTGFSPEKEPNDAMRRGSHYEAEARTLFNESKICEYKPCCGVHFPHEYCIASFDGYAGLDYPILEIKIPGKATWERAMKGEIPYHYTIQMQWQMFISGAESAFFCCYKPETKEMMTILLYRNEKLIRTLKMEADKFWESFILGSPPERQKKDKTIITDQKFYALAEERILLKGNMKILEEALEVNKKDILKYGTGGDFGGYGISVIQTKPRTTYDMEAMQKDGINIDKYKKETKNNSSYTINIDAWK